MKLSGRLNFPLLVLFLALNGCLRADEIAFFHALEADATALKVEGQLLGQPVKIGARAVQRVQLAGHHVYLIKMGSGAVETAVSAEALLARFWCDRAFSLGPVGAIGESLKVGQWVEVKEVVTYQKGAWSSSGFALGQRSRIAVDDKATVGLELPELWQKLAAVSIASGEIFIASDGYRAELSSVARAEAVDMNLYGLLTACANHQVPLVSWRVVSDRADDRASEDFQKFVAAYDGAGGKALARSFASCPRIPIRRRVIRSCGSCSGSEG